MNFRSAPPGRASRAVATAGAACAVLAAAACSSSSPAAPAPSPPASGSATSSGPVDVLYAGSLVNFMRKDAGPAFHAAAGYSVTGYAAGAKALATDIRGGIYKGDVFISASPAVNDSLQGAKNGSWVSWYATFATAPLVIGYNPGSRFASDLKTRPWWQVITEPGFRLGFTDPATDPKGQLAAEALAATAASKGLPALTAIERDQGDVFPEETLVGRLQAGQLDAGFFYTSESAPAGIPTVPLAGVDLKATYTVTILAGAPHEAGAQAFVSWLLGPAGRAALRKAGFRLVTPATVTGSGVPSGLSGVLP